MAISEIEQLLIDYLEISKAKEPEKNREKVAGAGSCTRETIKSCLTGESRKRKAIESC